MTTFLMVWFGQTVSTIGSGLTSFALGVYVYQQTGSVAQFALIGLFAVAPRILVSPLVGPLIDRFDRRRAMMVSDLGAGLSTAALALLVSFDHLEVWLIYLLVLISSTFTTVQCPAYMASTTTLVSRENLGRANGLTQLGRSLAEILSPLLAGVLLLTIQFQGVILVDFITFLLAIGTLMIVRFPEPACSKAEATGKESWWKQVTFGLDYITARRGLFGLLLFLAAVNFLWGMVGALITPMILGFTSSDVLGLIISIAGGGMLAGSLLMSTWGGPRRKIKGVVFFELLSGVCFLAIGIRPNFWPVAAGVFGAHLTIAIVQGSNQAIWQSQVPEDIQGRVFSTQQMVSRSAAPLAFLLAGFLADRLFEPLLQVNGGLAGSAGQLVGVGAGRGIGLLFLIIGLVKIGLSVFAWTNPAIRQVEDEQQNSSWIPGLRTDAVL